MNGMNGKQMGKEVADAIMNMSAPPDVKAQCTELWEKICTAIVEHIQKNAIVPPGIAVTTAGNSSAQSGATTAPGSVK